MREERRNRDGNQEKGDVQKQPLVPLINTRSPRSLQFTLPPLMASLLPERRAKLRLLLFLRCPVVCFRHSECRTSLPGANRGESQPQEAELAERMKMNHHVNSSLK